jgi:spore coat polysaccharide biosynthesis protein SpsF
MKKYKTKKVTAIVLARLLSTRLKKKMLRKIDGQRSIDLFINRLKKCKKVNEIILATSSAYHDKIFKKIAKNHKIKFFSGSENDVLDRLNRATSHLDSEDVIVRANADNPIFMPTIVDTDIENFKKLNYEVFSPFFKNKLPFGYSFTIFKKSCISKINVLAKKKLHREHVENYCFDNRKKIRVLLSNISKNSKFYCPSLSVTMDTEKDLKKIRKYYSIIKKKLIKDQPINLINYFKNQ